MTDIDDIKALRRLSDHLFDTICVNSHPHMFLESLLVYSVFLERNLAPHSAIKIIRLDKLLIDLLFSIV